MFLASGPAGRPIVVLAYEVAGAEPNYKSPCSIGMQAMPAMPSELLSFER